MSMVEVGLAWVAGFVLLFGVGSILSHLTLRAASKVPTEAGGHAKGADLFLRRAYRVVLWACCAYYYVSLPLVVLLVLAVAGGLVYGMLMLGTIPVKLLLLIAILGFVTLSAVVKSLFVRVKDEDPGERLNLEEHPRLREVLHEVAERVERRPGTTRPGCS